MERIDVVRTVLFDEPDDVAPHTCKDRSNHDDSQDTDDDSDDREDTAQLVIPQRIEGHFDVLAVLIEIHRSVLNASIGSSREARKAG